MKTIILAMVMVGVSFAGGANGPKVQKTSHSGMFKTATYPVRHPIKSFVAVVTSPVHPIKTTKAVFHFVIW